MTRILILLFVLNTLLPSIGFTAMLSSNTNEIMSQSDHTMMMADHCSTMSSHDVCSNDHLSSELCKTKCANSCSPSATHISTFSFDIPFFAYSTEINITSPPLFTRSISPELRPPLA
ncbi:MAG TPA: hypothetical protein EYG68_11325 [Leucothrix mucor]|nr:hypothetical protein [Leucothrix mucor]